MPIKRTLHAALAAAVLPLALPASAQTFDAQFYARKYPSLVVPPAFNDRAKNCKLPPTVLAGCNILPETPAQKYGRHWVEAGRRQGREGSPDFSVGAYLARYPDLQQRFGNNYEAATQHWLTVGQKEGRDGRAAGTFMAAPGADQLDVDFYFNANPDLQRGGMDVPRLVYHYVTAGRQEGRKGNANSSVAGNGRKL